MSDQTLLFYRAGVALAIGLLIGLQREYAHRGKEEELYAGIRTFAMLTLTGFAGALLADYFHAPVLLGTLLLLLGGLVVLAYFFEAKRAYYGVTTEVTAILAPVVGALCYVGYVGFAVALGVVATTLLTFKVQMHGLAERLSREDIYATIKFAIVSAVVLPVLPNEPLGPPPLDVLKPYNIWLMVVLISGLSFAGYLAIKFAGPRRGVGLTGLLGGLASSTAVTFSFARQSRRVERLGDAFALGIIVAWTIMFARILIIVAAVNERLVSYLLFPLGAAMIGGFLYSIWLYMQRGVETLEDNQSTFTNPFELGPAIKFGLFYALILLVSRSAQMYFGDVGVYASSIFAGLADVDAISLSMAQLHEQGALDAETAAHAVVIAAVTNTLVKGGIAFLLGSAHLRRAVVPGMLLMLAGALGVMWLGM